MRTHFPVPETPYFPKEGESIVSTAGLEGHITCVNPRHVEVSGLTQDELAGAARNLVRHPGMSAQAHAGFLHTLQRSRPGFRKRFESSSLRTARLQLNLHSCRSVFSTAVHAQRAAQTASFHAA
jgi:hypothetical protein